MLAESDTQLSLTLSEIMGMDSPQDSPYPLSCKRLLFKGGFSLSLGAISPYDVFSPFGKWLWV